LFQEYYEVVNFYYYVKTLDCTVEYVFQLKAYVNT